MVFESKMQLLNQSAQHILSSSFQAFFWPSYYQGFPPHRLPRPPGPSPLEGGKSNAFQHVSQHC
jgi:hypothetical protein